jgi:Xaa-Pro aminopeptidase
MNERLQRAGSALKEAKVEALVVSNLTNIRYLTGFTGSNAILLVFPDRHIFWTDPRYTLQALKEVGPDAKVARGPLYLEAEKWLARRHKGAVGFERETLRFDQFEVLNRTLQLQPVSGLVERLRMVKSPEEIALIRAAVNTNSKAFESAAASAKPGMKESDLAALIDYRMRRFGAEGTAFETIVSSGLGTALPHATPGNKRFEEGDLVLVDMGAKQAGYCSDMTRMLHLGEPKRKTRQVYRAVLEAQLAAINSVRAGVSAAKVDLAARGVLKQHGWADQFVHSTGHGFGLEIHEDPRIGKKGTATLESGMVITIEPGVYLEGWGGIRIEDAVVVTETGCEILTSTSKQLRLINTTVT